MLEWRSHYLDLLKGEQFSPEYLRINPKGVVPTLVHDGMIVPESTVICEYVEETFPDRPIYPQSPYERSRVRVWTKAVDEELHPACSAITYIVSHRQTILRNGVGSFEEFLGHAGAEGIAARRLSGNGSSRELPRPARPTRSGYTRAIWKIWKVHLKIPVGSLAMRFRWRTLP